MIEQPTLGGRLQTVSEVYTDFLAENSLCSSRQRDELYQDPRRDGFR